jgi:hypothetical protein
MAIIIEAKDRLRIEDISRQPLEKQISSATKMAKLITILEKAERRWMASIEKLGSDHSVTNIFRQRVHDLRGGTVARELQPVSKVKAPAHDGYNRLNRRKEDFPIGCKIMKLGEDIAGLVTSHESFLDYILAKFNDSDEPVCIYDIKRV